MNNFLTNFKTYPAPFVEKLRLALRNNWRKLKTQRPCCGNLGQPGC